MKTKHIPSKIPKINEIKVFVPTKKKEYEKSSPKERDLDKRYISDNLYLLVFKIKDQSFLIYFNICIKFKIKTFKYIHFFSSLFIV